MNKALINNLILIFFLSLMILPLSFFHLAPTLAPLCGLTKLKFALAFTGLVAANSALVLSLLTVHKFAYAKKATSQYKTLKDASALDDDALVVYELGKRAKNWLPYIRSYSEIKTYKYPLVFRAGIESEVSKHGTKPS